MFLNVKLQRLQDVDCTLFQWTLNISAKSFQR